MSSHYNFINFFHQFTLGPPWSFGDQIWESLQKPTVDLTF